MSKYIGGIPWVSTSGDVQYIRGCSVHQGYHVYIGRCSVHRGIHDACGGARWFNLYWKPPMYSWYPPTCIMIPPDVLMVSPHVLNTPPPSDVLNIHQCTEHTLCRVIKVSVNGLPKQEFETLAVVSVVGGTTNLSKTENCSRMRLRTVNFSRRRTVLGPFHTIRSYFLIRNVGQVSVLKHGLPSLPI